MPDFTKFNKLVINVKLYLPTRSADAINSNLVELI